MFTGIIENTGLVKEVISNGSNKTFWVEASFSSELKIDQSVSHDGVCLTVEETRAGQHRVTAIDETLQKTNLDNWQIGTLVNLERCLTMNSRLDGHFVQGHVDTACICEKVKEKQGSREIKFSLPSKLSRFIIEKGSVCINGVSLTAFNVKKKSFCVAIIPYTLQHTNLKELKAGQSANLEFDIIGKYILRQLDI